MEIKIKKLSEQAIIPKKGSEKAAGFDLYSLSEKVVAISPQETAGIHTGIAVEIPNGYFGGIYARSGLALKQGLRPANCVGVIDSDYRGEIIVALHNDSSEVRIVESGERIAQMIIQPYLDCSFSENSKLNDTERGNGGFGSTGIK